MPRPAALLVLLAFAAPAPADEPAWESLLPAVDARRDAARGAWEKSPDGLRVRAAAGAALALPAQLPAEYDVRATFTRTGGVHSVALFFGHGRGRAAFEADAWGERLGGVQNVAGRSIRDNPTRRNGVALENGRRHTMTVEVRAGRVRAALDGRTVSDFHTDGGDLALSNLWPLPAGARLGLGAWESDVTFHSVELRRVGGAAAARPTPAQPPTPAPSLTSGAAGKRVVIVLANHHFFYREYADPRAELERAGVRVTVAAGRRAPCRPHPGSGQGPDGGGVRPDLTLAEVRADDFDAILFSGGWGSSCYQFAFPGRYSDPEYNGTPAVKAEANRVVGEFLAKEKYVAALCNAVSVLAWARVDGRSPLRGVRVCAPPRQAAPGIYNGRPGQPSCRWHPEVNGALLLPAGSVGRPGTAEDDVSVDGRILTGEDDVSAREMGRKLVGVLGGR